VTVWQRLQRRIIRAILSPSNSFNDMPVFAPHQSYWIARFRRHAVLAGTMAAVAIAGQKDSAPRPQGFVSAPAPSSLVLLLAGLAVLLAWNWWRGRGRGQHVSRD
jgi:hypothetical protein